MDAGTRAARRGRRVAGFVAALGVGIVALVVAVALTWPTISGWFSPDANEPGNTLLVSAPEQIATARAQLEALVVAPRPDATGGYRRSAFGDAWTDTDHNGCNQRDDVLLRDVDRDHPYRVGRQGSCDHDVLAGTWVDPYTGATITLTDAKAQGQEVQVDHIVALSVAWRYGANTWSAGQRLAFANDLRELVAVGGNSNQGKGNADASQWRPVRGAQCGYAVRYVAVKSAYALPTDATEKKALADMLVTCG
jgi:hypothetical protein